MSPMPYPSPAWKLENRNPAQKMKNTFHSSGTANGNVEMMNVWSIQIEMIATHVAGRHGANKRTSGMMISHVVPPMCAMECVIFDGRMSFG